MKDEGTPIVDHRVPCVGSALVANHCVDIAGQDVDDLALAFVAPLRPDDYEITHRLAMLPKKQLWQDRKPEPGRGHRRSGPVVCQEPEWKEGGTHLSKSMRSF